MTKRVVFSDEARADIRGIDRETAPRLLKALARFLETRSWRPELSAGSVFGASTGCLTESRSGKRWYTKNAVERAAIAVRWVKAHSAAFFMYLLYLDDAGSPGNINEEYFVLGGICVYEAQADWFTREIDKLAAAFDPTSPEDVEFHASTIFSRREGPWKGLGIDDARGALKGVLNVVRSSYNTTRLFACAIHKQSYPNQDPVESAFEDLCQRFDLFLARQRQAGDPQRGLLILDKTTRETTIQRLSREFRKVGTKWGVLRNLADTPLFVDSRASRLVQIADHVAYAVFRRYNSGDAQYLDIIASRFDEADGVIHGLVHKHAERSICTCPGCLSRRRGRGSSPESPK